MSKNISIIGSGSWGVALGIHLAKLGNNIKMWSYKKIPCMMITVSKIPNPRKLVCKWVKVLGTHPYMSK